MIPSSDKKKLASGQKTLDQQLALFLKRARGDGSYAAFSRKTGLTPSTLFRLENCQQTITLRRLERVMKRLKITLVDVFAGQ